MLDVVFDWVGLGGLCMAWVRAGPAVAEFMRAGGSRRVEGVRCRVWLCRVRGSMYGLVRRGECSS